MSTDRPGWHPDHLQSTLSTVEDDVVTRGIELRDGQLGYWCRDPSHSSWPFSAFSFKSFCPIQRSSSSMHSAKRVAACWLSTTGALIYLCIIRCECPISPRDAMMSNNSAVRVEQKHEGRGPRTDPRGTPKIDISADRRPPEQTRWVRSETWSTPIQHHLGQTLAAAWTIKLEMGKNRHLLGSVLFGFYEYQGSVRFGFLSVF